MAGSQISVVVPTFNESENIGPLVARIGGALLGLDWEVVIVDDNSPDGTARLARQMSLDDDRVRAILRVADRGLARACIQGMLSSKGELICVMDADGQHDPHVIQRMVDRIGNGDVDMVSASRRLEVADPRALSASRRAFSKAGNFASNIVLGRQLTDPLTGFFVIRRGTFFDLAQDLGDPGFKLLLDILISRPALRHAEVPFEFGARRSGASKLDSLVAWQFMTFLVSKLTRGILPASFVSFLFVGGTGVFVHLVVLYSALGTGSSFSFAQTCAALVAATSNFLLNNLLTFRDRRLSGSRMVVGYLKFLVVSSIGIVANVSAATVAYENLGQMALLATFAGIALDTIWKFVVANRFVWR